MLLARRTSFVVLAQVRVLPAVWSSFIRFSTTNPIVFSTFQLLRTSGRSTEPYNKRYCERILTFTASGSHVTITSWELNSVGRCSRKRYSVAERRSPVQRLQKVRSLAKLRSATEQTSGGPRSTRSRTSTVLNSAVRWILTKLCFTQSPRSKVPPSPMQSDSEAHRCLLMIHLCACSSRSLKNPTSFRSTRSCFVLVGL